MASKIELTRQALSEMEKATIPPKEWCRRIQKGYLGKPYDYENTYNYRASQFLFEAANTAVALPPSPGPPPITSDLSDVQRCLFLTNDISRALECRNRLLIATADLRYREYYSGSFLNEAIKQNRLRVWCDCHETFPPTAKDWLDQLGLPHSYFYGECESKEAFTVAYEAGSRKMVGNLSVLTDGQITAVRSGVVHVTNETYYNKDPNYRVDWRNANQGVGSNCMACYASTSENASYYPFAQQARDGKYNPSTDCIYVAGLEPADWAFLITN